MPFRYPLPSAKVPGRLGVPHTSGLMFLFSPAAKQAAETEPFRFSPAGTAVQKSGDVILLPRLGRTRPESTRPGRPWLL